MDRKPLVVGDDGRPQQLQGSDDLKIPLENRVARLEQWFADNAAQLLELGLSLPEGIAP